MMDAKKPINAKNAKNAKNAAQQIEGQQAHEEEQLPVEELTEEELDETTGGTIATIIGSAVSGCTAPANPSPPTVK